MEYNLNNVTSNPALPTIRNNATNDQTLSVGRARAPVHLGGDLNRESLASYGEVSESHRLKNGGIVAEAESRIPGDAFNLSSAENVEGNVGNSLDFENNYNYVPSGKPDFRAILNSGPVTLPAGEGNEAPVNEVQGLDFHYV